MFVVSCALGPHVFLPFQKLILTVSFSCLACISCSQQSHILSCFRLWDNNYLTNVHKFPLGNKTFQILLNRVRRQKISLIKDRRFIGVSNITVALPVNQSDSPPMGILCCSDNAKIEYIEDITRRREDMTFIFEWLQQYFTNERSELVKYCF